MFIKIERGPNYGHFQSISEFLNKAFPSSPQSRFQNESRDEVVVELVLLSVRMKTHTDNKDFTVRFALKETEVNLRMAYSILTGWRGMLLI